MESEREVTEKVFQPDQSNQIRPLIIDPQEYRSFRTLRLTREDQRRVLRIVSRKEDEEYKATRYYAQGGPSNSLHVSDYLKDKYKEVHDLLDRRDDEVIDESIKITSQLRDDHWGVLTPFERRIVDVCSSESPLYASAIEPMVDLMSKGKRLDIDETEFNERKARTIWDDIYGRSDVHKERRFGRKNPSQVAAAHKFAQQREFVGFFGRKIEEGLSKIPEDYTINRAAVRSFYEEVIAKFRDRGDIGLSLNPHLESPYSNEEWGEGLRKQLDAAPRIAQKLLGEFKSLVAVTLYGPITRDDKDYVMFHPKEGLELGALFEKYDPKIMREAVERAEQLGDEDGLTVKTGTGHSGMFGAVVYTWNLSDFDHLEDLEKRNDRLPLHLTDQDFLLELYTQVSLGKPISTRDEQKFMRAKRLIDRHYTQLLAPIFTRSQFLHAHLENGYPYPVEQNHGR